MPVLLLMFLNWLDVYLTEVAFRHGVLEANPIANCVIVMSGLTGLLIIKLTICLLLLMFYDIISSKLYLKILLWLAVFGYAALNIYHIINLKGIAV